MKNSTMEKMLQETFRGQTGFLQGAVQEVLQKVLIEEFNQFIGAKAYERTDQRIGMRNGTYERSFNTRVGTVHLKVCRDRDGQFKSDIFEKYQGSEKALVLTIMEMYIDGVSTRKVSAITEKLCGLEISKSQVSDLVKKLDVVLEQWRSRQLVDEYKHLVVDARYEKIRENGRVISKAFVTIIGITAEGKREIIGCYVINSESFEAWDSCFSNLKNRGLKGVSYIVSDENAGLKSAIKKHFQGASWQRCQVHFMRNFMSKLVGNIQKEGVKLLQDLFAAPSREDIKNRLKTLTDFLLKQKKESVAQWLEDNIEDSLAVYNLPENHRKKMRSTNMVERLTRVVRIFPNEQSCVRLLSAICLEISEEWDNRRYLDM